MADIRRGNRWIGFACFLIGSLVAAAHEADAAPARCEGIETDVAGSRRCLRPLDVFRDCAACPELVVIPAGRFLMGSPKDEPGRNMWFEDQVPVTFARPFAIGRFAVTRDEFAAFVAATGHKTDIGCSVDGALLSPRGWGRSDYDGWKDFSWRSPGLKQDDRHPVTCVDWADGRAYAAWLASVTGSAYRLPSEAEREYATRAGTTTPYWWGSTITAAQANYDSRFYDPRGIISKPQGDYRKTTVPVDSFAPNPWGLYNVHGNVLEWTEDCFNKTHAGNPGNGDARIDGCRPNVSRVMRGGCWSCLDHNLRAANRQAVFQNGPYRLSNTSGFRVARSL